MWEAAIAAASLRLDRLVAVVDRNGLQLTGSDRATSRRWNRWPTAGAVSAGRSATWTATTATQLADHLAAAPWEPGRPSVLIARTVKGHGLPFLAGRSASHYVTLSPRNHARAVRAALAADAAG